MAGTDTGKRSNGNIKQIEAKVKMAAICPHISIIIQNVNGQNSLIKRCRVARQIEKQDPAISCLQETHL